MVGGRMRWIMMLAAMLALLARPAAAQSDGAPVPVRVGIFVVHLTPPDLKSGQFETVFWLWFRWKGDADLDPMKKFEVVNGLVEALDNEDAKEAHGEHYRVARVRATITQSFDISRFPMDSHELQIGVEETTESVAGITYVPDRENSSVETEITLAGWRLGKARAEGTVKTYASNFGDVALPADAASAYARFTLVVPVSRPGIDYPIKLFWTLYLSVLVAVLAFWIKATDLDPRFGLGIGAVFAAMASAYVISGALPDSNQMTIADKVVMWSIGFIVVSMLESIISLRFFHAGREEVGTKLDRISFWVFSAGYILVNVVLLRG